jgi:hypothetical protein
MKRACFAKNPSIIHIQTPRITHSVQKDHYLSRKFGGEANAGVKNTPASDKNIRINGKIPDPNSPDGPALITQAELQEDAMPFKGAGAKPRPMTGPILEMKLHQQNTREPVQVSFQLK